MHKKVISNVFVLALTVVFLLSSITKAEKILTEQEAKQRFEKEIRKLGWAEKKRYREMFNDEKSQHKPIQFFGKVIDQFGQPVPDANVTIGVTTMYSEKGTKTVPVMTDADGLFVLNDIGTLVFVRKIEKWGYEFTSTSEVNPERGFNYDTLSGPCHIPDHNNPVEFYMRKMGERAFLIKQPLSIRLMAERNENNAVKNYDLLGEQLAGWIDANSVWHDIKEHFDVQVEAKLFDEPNAYRIVFKALDPNSGFIVSDELSYKAPLEGYVSEIVFDGNIPKDAYDVIEKYVYIKARNGQIYSRLKLNLKIQGNEGRPIILIGGSFWSNSEGTQTLEYYEKYNFQEEERRLNIKKQTKEMQRQERLRKKES